MKLQSQKQLTSLSMPQDTSKFQSVHSVYQFLSHSKYNVLHQLLNILAFLLLLFIMVYFMMMSGSQAIYCQMVRGGDEKNSQAWAYLRNYSGICLETMKKTTKTVT